MVDTENTTSQEQVNGRFNLYKGRKTGDGAASSWRMGTSQKGDSCVFIEIAKQTGELDENGNSTFDWRKYDKETKKWSTSSSVVAKLGLPDVGEILLVLDGVNKKAGYEGKGLFHKNKTGSTTINFETWERDGNLLGFTLRLASKGTDNKINQVSHAINLAEATILRTLLNNSILRMVNW